MSDRSLVKVSPAARREGAPELRAVSTLRRKTIGKIISSIRRGTATAVHCQSWQTGAFVTSLADRVIVTVRSYETAVSMLSENVNVWGTPVCKEPDAGIVAEVFAPFLAVKVIPPTGVVVSGPSV